MCFKFVSTKQRILLAGTVGCGLVVIFVLGRVPEVLLTEFPATFRREAFSKLRVGDSLVALTNAIGAPFDFIVYPTETSDGSPLPIRTNLAELFQYSSKGNMILLRFSRPKVLEDHYKIYEVFIQSDAIDELRSYWYRD
jgi:hypothetical protein